MSSITDIKKLIANQIEITLTSGDADLPYAFADYHVLIVPNGFTDFSKPDGTGAYTLESFEPGVRVITKRKRATTGSRTAAISTASSCATSPTRRRARRRCSPARSTPPTASTPGRSSLVMKAPTVNVVRTKGTGNRFAFVARCVDRSLHQQRHPPRAEIRHRPPEDHRHRLQGLCDDRQRHHDRALGQILRQGHAAAPLRSRQGRLPLQEGRHGRMRSSSCRSRKAPSPARPTPRCSIRKRMKKARHRPRTSSASRATAIGTMSGSRRRSAPCIGAAVRPSTNQLVADLPLDRQLERHRTGSARSSTSSSSRRAPSSTRPSARRCTPRPRG